ncbi:MAG: hypothetical protein C4324_03320 [Blastocatellia bacterium]
MFDPTKIRCLADISIPLRFRGQQPNAYGVSPARSEPVRAGDLVGDTRLGGSVNFERYELIPHCNGTHTECVGHITYERISLRDCLRDIFFRARLVSIEPVFTRQTVERLTPLHSPGDLVITRDAIASTIAGDIHHTAGLIVRSLPNETRKTFQSYDAENLPPYFTLDAMEAIVAAGISHLIVDLPSIDRLFDGGVLQNHRLFWRVPEGSFAADSRTRRNTTITELVFVPDEVPDGEYLVNLQIPPFESDAAPSRPLLCATD